MNRIRGWLYMTTTILLTLRLAVAWTFVWLAGLARRRPYE